MCVCMCFSLLRSCLKVAECFSLLRLDSAYIAALCVCVCVCVSVCECVCVNEFLLRRSSSFALLHLLHCVCVCVCECVCFAPPKATARQRQTSTVPKIHNLQVTASIACVRACVCVCSAKVQVRVCVHMCRTAV